MASVRHALHAVALAAALALGAPALAAAEEWQIIGARYEGMGGAGVAAAFEADAADWNPGMLAFSPLRTEEVSLRGGVTAAAEGGFLDHAGDLVDFVDQTHIDRSLEKLRGGGTLDESELRNALTLFVRKAPRLAPSGQGAQATADAALQLRRARFVLSARGFGFVGADPRYDVHSFALGADGAIGVAQLVGAGQDRSAEFSNPGSLALAQQLTQAGSGLTSAQAQELVFQAEQAGINTSAPGVRNTLLDLAGPAGAGQGSGVLVRGLYVKQLALAYGFPLIEGVLGVGGQLKYLHGTSVYEFVGIDATGGTERSPHSPRRRDREWGLDLGLLYTPQPWLRLGLSSRNLNTPSFKTVRPHAPIELRPQLRAGLALQIHPRITLAADLDLTRNDFESIGGLRSRMLAMGAEYRTRFRRWTCDFRAGAHRNLARGPDRDVTLTLGFGLHVRASRFDLAFSYGLGGKRVEHVGAHLPRRADVAGGLRWVREF